MLKGRHMIPNIFIINATYQLVSSKQAQEIKVAKFTPVTTHKQPLVPKSLQSNSRGWLILKQGIQLQNLAFQKPTAAIDPEG